MAFWPEWSGPCDRFRTNALIYNTFNLQPHLIRRSTLRLLLTETDFARGGGLAAAMDPTGPLTTSLEHRRSASSDTGE